MKRKFSICMGIAIVITLLYVIYLCWYIYSSYNDTIASSDYIKSAAVAVAGVLLLPHLGLSLLAFIFLAVAFFTNIFGMALTAGILFSVAALAFFPYAPFLIPSIVLSFVGSAFCKKKKRLSKEEEEDRIYQQNKSQQAKPQRNVQTYSQRQIEHQDLGYQQGQRVFQQPMYPNQMQQMQPMYMNGQIPAQPYGNMTYGQDPYLPLDQSMMNDMYANTMQMPLQQANFQQSMPQQPMMPQYPQTMQTQAYFQPNEMPVYQQPQNTFVAPPPMSNQVNDGYFDDYGNFHFHNN